MKGVVAYDVDKRPGWVAAQVAHRERVLWLGTALGFLVIVGFLFLAVNDAVGIVGSLAFLALFLAIRAHAYEYLDETMRRFVRGARAEETVGNTLDELRREGWILMHDVAQAFEGNIDHIAWGPEQGVFMIETKARRYEEDQLTKAKRQAAKLGGEFGVFVTPVICLNERRGKPFHHKGVDIVPRQHLLDWLRRQRNKTVPFERLARYADRVD